MLNSANLFATGEKSAAHPAEAFTAFTPEALDIPRDRPAIRCCVLRKSTMMSIKNHENLWDQWMGTPRIGYLSWVLSFNCP